VGTEKGKRGRWGIQTRSFSGVKKTRMEGEARPNQRLWITKEAMYSPDGRKKKLPKGKRRRSEGTTVQGKTAVSKRSQQEGEVRNRKSGREKRFPPLRLKDVRQKRGRSSQQNGEELV